MELIGSASKYVFQTLLILCALGTAMANDQNTGDRSTKEQEMWIEQYTKAMLMRHKPEFSTAVVIAELHKAADYAQKEIGAESYYYVTTARALAKQYEKMGDLEKAESLLLEIYQIIMVNKNHNAGEYYTQPLQDLIKFYDRRGEADKKQKYIDEMNEILAPYFEETKELDDFREALKARQVKRSPCSEE